MSKPMVVTLPFVLLLIDFWPLNRLQLSSSARTFIHRLLKSPFLCPGPGGEPGHLSGPKRRRGRLVFGAFASPGECPVSCCDTSPKPSGRLICGRLSLSPPLADPAADAAILTLTFWTGLFLWRLRQNPYLAIGWFWFLGTLVPVIGIVQVGPQSMADRFTYVPGIGLFILIVWSLADFAVFHPSWRNIVVPAGVAALAGCLVCTHFQLKYWQNSITLLRHTVAVTTDNYIAENFLGRALDDAGENDLSLPLYAESVRIESHFPQAQFNLGMAWRTAARLIKPSARWKPPGTGAR